MSLSDLADDSIESLSASEDTTENRVPTPSKVAPRG